MQEKIKLFVAPSFDTSPPVLFLRLLTTPENALSPGLKKLNEDLQFNIQIVWRMEDSDFVIIPYAVKHITPAYQSYVRGVVFEASKHKKHVIIILRGDLSYREHIEGPFVFKISAFRHAIRPNEVIHIPFADDIARETHFVPRRKSATPSVSFCGFAGFNSFRTRLKYIAKNTLLDAAAYASRKPHLTAYKRGVYFRRTALSIIRSDSRIDSHIILRDSFFAQAAPSSDERQAMKREYVKNLVGADFALAPRGDANISIRFYEALSAGRIPILIDTDCVLPLEKTIDYDSFILRVPHTKMHELPERIIAFYEKLSDEEFVAMQYRAREAFEKYLRYDSFFNAALPLLKERGPQGL